MQTPVGVDPTAWHGRTRGPPPRSPLATAAVPHLSVHGAAPMPHALQLMQPATVACGAAALRPCPCAAPHATRLVSMHAIRQQCDGMQQPGRAVQRQPGPALRQPAGGVESTAYMQQQVGDMHRPAAGSTNVHLPATGMRHPVACAAANQRGREGRDRNAASIDAVASSVRMGGGDVNRDGAASTATAATAAAEAAEAAAARARAAARDATGPAPADAAARPSPRQQRAQHTGPIPRSARRRQHRDAMAHVLVCMAAAALEAEEAAACAAAVAVAEEEQDEAAAAVQARARAAGEGGIGRAAASEAGGDNLAVTQSGDG
eukprot:364264-Chlamydomonas_euryale.AAC.5